MRSQLNKLHFVTFCFASAVGKEYARGITRKQDCGGRARGISFVSRIVGAQILALLRTRKRYTYIYISMLDSVVLRDRNFQRVIS